MKAREKGPEGDELGAAGIDGRAILEHSIRAGRKQR